MSIEERLKEMIIQKYGSITKAASSIGLPYSTIQSILRRGVHNCNGQNLQAICSALNISASALMEGRIEPIIFIDVEEPREKFKLDKRLQDYFNSIKYDSTLDGIDISVSEADYINRYISMIFDIIRAKRLSENNGKDDK